MRKTLIALCVLLLVLAGCTAQQTQSTPYSWAESYESSEPSRPETQVTEISSSIKLVGVNGQEVTNEQPVTFNGSPITFDFQFDYEVNAPIDVQFICLLDGILQPFTSDTESEPVTGKMMRVDNKGIVEFRYIISEPVIDTAGKPAHLRFAALFNYNGTVPKDSRWSPSSACSSFDFQFFDNSANETGPSAADLSAVSPTDSVQVKSLSSYTEPQNLQGMPWSGFSKFMVYSDKDPLFQKNYFSYRKGDGLSLVFGDFSESGGHYRGMIYIGENPIEPFDDKQYFEWTTTDDNTRFEVKIPDAYLPDEGDVSISLVYMNLDTELDSIGKIDNGYQPITLHIEK